MDNHKTQKVKPIAHNAGIPWSELLAQVPAVPLPVQLPATVPVESRRWPNHLGPCHPCEGQMNCQAQFQPMWLTGEWTEWAKDLFFCVLLCHYDFWTTNIAKSLKTQNVFTVPNLLKQPKCLTVKNEKRSCIISVRLIRVIKFYCCHTQNLTVATDMLI